MNMIEVTFSNNQEGSFPKYTSYYDIGKFLDVNNKYLAVLTEGKIVSLHEKIEKNQKVDFLEVTSASGNRIYLSGLKMLFEYVVKKMYPKYEVEYLYNLPRGIVAKIKTADIVDDNFISQIKKTIDYVVQKNIVIEKLTIKSKDGLDYYHEIGNKVKEENIKNINDSSIVLYRLDDLINYYYSEMPYSTGVITKYEIINLGNNLLAINYPNENDNSIIPNYVNYQPIVDTYTIGSNWLDTMKVPYINDVNQKIIDGKISNFVKSCELNFNISINETAKEIAKNDAIKCVMIAGPSSSGKTTVTKRIANYFEIYGKDPIVISLDDYYHEIENTPKDQNGEYDFECLESLDLEYLANDVKKLLNGETIVLPQYDFERGHKNLTGKKVKINDQSIILFEGLHALNDKVLPFIPNGIKYKIYVSPFIPLRLDQQNYISSNDLRILRRIVRNFQSRGNTAEKVLQNIIKVQKGEDKHITPFIPQAQKIINTSLSYEVGVLKVYVEPLLFSVTSDSPYYNDARRLLSFLKQFFTISSEYVSKDSILREFIGGDKND